MLRLTLCQVCVKEKMDSYILTPLVDKPDKCAICGSKYGVLVYEAKSERLTNK